MNDIFLVEEIIGRHLKNTKTAVKANSPYFQIENKMSDAVKQLIQNTIHPSDVAKAILEAVTSDAPDFTYVVGKNGTMIIEARKNMSEREFQFTGLTYMTNQQKRGDAEQNSILAWIVMFWRERY